MARESPHLSAPNLESNNVTRSTVASDYTRDTSQKGQRLRDRQDGLSLVLELLLRRGP